jgi:hypothetical protein
MIRPFTLITMILAALSGAYLFAVKHRAQVLDDALAATAQQSRMDAQRIEVLQAQWALEIDPTRLTRLAAQFTTLAPMQNTQMVALAALPEVLPPPGSAPVGGNPELPAAPAIADLVADSQASAATPAGPDIAAPDQALPLPPPQPPVEMMVAFTRDAPRPARRSSHSLLHIANTQYAESLPPPRPLYSRNPTSQSGPQSLPQNLSGSTSIAAPMGAQLMSVKATASLPAPVNSASALGQSAYLAPPQPLNESGN